MFTAHTLGGTLFVSLLDLKRPVLLVLVATLARNDLLENILAVLPHLGELESGVVLVLSEHIDRQLVEVKAVGRPAPRLAHSHTNCMRQIDRSSFNGHTPLSE